MNSTPRVSLNLASREELGAILGLGPDLSEDIVNYREANGPFLIWEVLKNIQGVTDGLIFDMKNWGARL